MRIGVSRVVEADVMERFQSEIAQKHLKKANEMTHL
jgi:hypothetical protein